MNQTHVTVELGTVGASSVALINVGWPRAAVYDPPGQSWVLHYSAPLSVVFAVGLELVAFRVMKRQRA